VVRVRPFKKGSFLSDLILTAPAWAPLAAQWGQNSYTYIQKVLEIVGFVKSGGESVLKVIEKLRKPPARIEETKDGFRYHSPDVKNPILRRVPARPDRDTGEAHLRVLQPERRHGVPP
jgi:hypothetical protein